MTRPLAVFVVALFVPAVAAQEPARFDVLRGLLKYQGVETPLATMPAPGEDCSDLVLVVIGRPPANRTLQALSRQCVSTGGAVLVATDGPADLSDYLPRVPGRIHFAGVGGRPVTCRNPDACLNQNPIQPLLAGRVIPGGAEPPDAMLLGVGQLRAVAANAGGVLDLPDGDHLLAPLLVYPARSADVHGVSASLRPAAAVLVQGSEAGLRGTAVLAANDDLFGNDLTAAAGPDQQLRTDNFALAYLLTRHLVVAGDRKRTRCLFIENGQVVTDFDAVRFAALPPVNPPLPPLDQLQLKLVDEANRFMGEWQDRDGPSRAILGENAERLPGILRVLAVAAVIALGVLLVKAWRAARLPTDLPRRPPPPPGRFDPPADQQADELVRADNLTEPARAHLRAVFARWGAAGDELPPVQVTGRLGYRVERDIAELWRVAAGQDEQAVTAARWKELRDMVQSVSRAADAGRWTFAARGSA